MSNGVLTVQLGGKTFEDIEAAFASLALEHIAPAFDGAAQAVKPELMKALQLVAKEMQRQHSSTWNGSVFNPTNNLQLRTGQGLKSIVDSIKVNGASGDTIAAGQISAGKLSIHETGGTIKATRSQYLTIPLPAAMDPRGVPLRQRARQWDHTFVKKSKSGNLLIFRRLPGARELTPLYLLKTSVKIKPRLRMEPAFDKQMGYFENKLFEVVSNYIDQHL